MSKYFKNILSLSIITFIFILPTFSWAQSTEGPDGPSTEGPSSASSQVIEIKNPFKENTIQDLIKVIIDEILLPIGGVIAVLMVMYSGFMYVTAQGDPGKIKKARDSLLAAVIGAAILLGAWVISTAITKTINELRVGVGG